MEELYNPQINQTLILMGDYHSDLLSEKDQEQLDGIIEAAKKYNAYILIENKVKYVENVEKSVERCNDKGLILLHKLPLLCMKKYIPALCIDFRQSSGRLLGYTDKACKEKKTCLKKIKKEWQKEPHRDIIPYLISSVIHDNKKIIEALKCYYDLLLSQNPIQNGQIELNKQQYYDQRMILLLSKEIYYYWGVVNNALRVFHGLKQNNGFEQNKKELISLIVENTFVDGKEICRKKDGIIQIVWDTASDLFDLHILNEIHRKREKRVLFVVAGGKHTNNVGRILQDLGFVSQGKRINNQDKMYADTAKHKDNDTLLNHYWANIQDFFGCCKSLEK